MKYLAINLTKDVQDLYTKNYTTLLEETKDVINKKIVIDWKLKIKVLILPKVNYRVHVISIEVPTEYLI